MKKIFTLLILLQTVLDVGKSQTINICSGYCNRILSNKISTLTVGTTTVSYCRKVSGNCTTVPYFDAKYEENNCDGESGINDCSDETTSLLIHVYYPVITAMGIANCLLL